MYDFLEIAKGDKVTMNIDICKLELENIKLQPRDSEKIRGYLSNKYKDLDILHNHKDDKFIYRYPKVQYKVLNNNPIIIGINDGVDIVSSIGINDDKFIIGDKLINTYEKRIYKKSENYGINEDYIEYKFVSPWVALNQKNISDYKKSNQMEKEEILRKVLIGNIISMSKGLNYTIEDKVQCWLNLKEKEVNIKGIKHTCFLGDFKVNFNIPNYLGIGKNVSKGFGTIKRVK